MLQLTSMLFASNVAHALKRRHLFYAMLLVFLTATSLVWHSSNKDTRIDSILKLFWIDQIAIWSVALMSIYYLFQMKSMYKWIVFVVITIMTGLAGYVLWKWWNNDDAHEYHLALHIMGAICSHCILLGSGGI